MKVIFSFVILMIATGNQIFSQTLYQLQYQFNTPEDTITYHSLFIKFDNGSGELRVHFKNPADQSEVLAKMVTEEVYVTDLSGSFDENRIIYKCKDPRIIRGSLVTPITLPTFLFTYNKAADFLEPTGLVDPLKIPEMNTHAVFSQKFISLKNVKRDALLPYFDKDDAFIENNFKLKTRGNTPIDPTRKMYLIVVANTRDPLIGSACEKDMIRTMQTYKELAKFLHIEVDSQKIFGDRYSKKNVQDVVNNLRARPNDLVIFYYTGHGYRKTLPKANDWRKFPFMDLRSKPEEDYLVETLNMEADIFNVIKKKHNGFNLVLSDCCNSDIQSIPPQGPKPLRTRGSEGEMVEPNVQQLFLNKHPVSILATAAKSGQKATCNNEFGGFFSYFFKTSMEAACRGSNPKPDWAMILEDTREQTDKKAKNTYCDKPNICDQTPDYIIR